jgi:hypothetical protein
MESSAKHCIFLLPLTAGLWAAMPASLPAQPDDGGNRARFSSVPITTPAYTTNPYWPQYNGPYGGYLSGAADVINAQGQMMVSQQQAFLMREQVRQASIETRRKNLDEYLYERAVTPTTEDERERYRLEQLRRSRNDPPLTEIWSGKALNDLLLGIQQQQAKNIQGPDVPLQSNMLDRINVTSGATPGSVGVLRDGGKLRWPFVLKGSAYKADRQNLDKLALEATRQAQAGSVDADTLGGMSEASSNLRATLRDNVAETSPNDYIKGQRFLNEIDDTIKMLQDPNVANYVTHKWAAKGNNVAQLVQQMSGQGLKFAPAVSGDEPAYVSLHQAMVAYYAGPELTKRWDTLAK